MVKETSDRETMINILKNSAQELQKLQNDLPLTVIDDAGEAKSHPLNVDQVNADVLKAQTQHSYADMASNNLKKT